MDHINRTEKSDKREKNTKKFDFYFKTFVATHNDENDKQCVIEQEDVLKIIFDACKLAQEDLTDQQLEEIMKYEFMNHISRMDKSNNRETNTKKSFVSYFKAFVDTLNEKEKKYAMKQVNV